MKTAGTYVIDLKEMQADTAEYRYVLGDDYFARVDGPEVSHGQVDALLTVKRLKGVYKLSFHLQGTVQVTCDRCLDLMDLPIDTHDGMTVKLGAAAGVDDDDVVTVPDDDGTIDVAWTLYELIALSIPIQRVHPEGQCNPEMSARLSALSHEAGAQQADKTVDPRWARLKDIDNNN